MPIMVGNMVTLRQGVGVVTESSHLIHKQEVERGKEITWNGMTWTFKSSKPTPVTNLFQ